MQTITRYIIFDLIKVTLLTLFGMTAVIILALVAKEAVDEGLGPLAVLRLIPYVLPEAMRYTVPGALLLAVTNIYGRMSANNEIVAIKSLGISPRAIIWPTLVLSIFASFATVWLNDIAVSWGRIGMQRIILESLEEIVYSRLESRKKFSAAGLTMTVHEVDGKRLIHPTIMLRKSDGTPSTTITADEAEISTNKIDGTVLLKLKNPKGGQDGWRLHAPNTEEIVLSLDEFTKTKNKSLSPSNRPLSQIDDEIKRQKKLIADTKEESAAATAYRLVVGDFEGLASKDVQQREIVLSKAERSLSRLRTEPHRRWANGFCCLSFALVGIPIAIKRKHGEFLASFFVCFLPVLLLFYPMLFLGIGWAKAGRIPPFAVWTGNAVFAVWGYWLLQRVYRC